ncbi:MAG: DNA polymerase III subunit beta [bacterium]|nr:DNA polymerase III subunit beta [bacterium]
MEIIILKNHLKSGLEAINRICGEKDGTTLPILKNFLIETVDNKIKLIMTNLELAITVFIPGKVIKDGDLTIPFNIFNSIINNLQSERINLENKDNKLIIKTDNYLAKIQGIKKEEFPIIPKIDKNQPKLEINASIFKKSLLSLISAAQISETKPELNGILFDFQQNSLKLAATDSFRLTEKIIINTQFKSNIDKEFKIIIPLKTVQEIIRIFKEDEYIIDIYFDQNQIFLKTENLEIISRLINGNFPDYQQIIPENFETEIVLGKEQLINALKLTGAFTDRLNEVKAVIEEGAKNIEIQSSNQTLGENKYLIPAKINGQSLEIIFNWRFLLDGIKGLDSENVFIGFNGDNKPALIKSPGDVSYFYIIMPIKSS